MRVFIEFMRGPLARILFMAALAAGGCGTVDAQTRTSKAKATMAVDGHALTLTPQETRALSDLQGALGGQPAAQDKALAAARGAAQSPDARYVLALYQLEIGQRRNDDALRVEALDTLIASDLTPRETLPGYLSVRGGIAYQRGDLETARTLWTRLLALRPNDAGVLANLAQVRQSGSDPNGAADLLGRAIAEQNAAGKPVSEALYRQWMSAALQGGQVQPGIAAAHALVRAYPSPANWRDALAVYRQLARPQGRLEIDLYRLMRITGSLSQEAEYQRMAQLLEQIGQYPEARAVMEEGVTRQILDPLDARTHEIIAEINRRLQRQPPPPVTPDANAAETGTRLGMTMAQGGMRDQARTAFRAIAAQPGGYAELAQFWLDWLAQ